MTSNSANVGIEWRSGRAGRLEVESLDSEPLCVLAIKPDGETELKRPSAPATHLKKNPMVRQIKPARNNINSDDD